MGQRMQACATCHGKEGRAAPDGYTILLGADPTFSGNQFLFKKMPFNSFTDLVPITRVVQVNMAFIAAITLSIMYFWNVANKALRLSAGVVAARRSAQAHSRSLATGQRGVAKG